MHHRNKHRQTHSPNHRIITTFEVDRHAQSRQYTTESTVQNTVSRKSERQWRPAFAVWFDSTHCPGGRQIERRQSKKTATELKNCNNHLPTPINGDDDHVRNTSCIWDQWCIWVWLAQRQKNLGCFCYITKLSYSPTTEGNRCQWARTTAKHRLGWPGGGHLTILAAI
jgi:hypothetical protein